MMLTEDRKKTRKDHFEHFKQRLSERYGIIINEAQYNLLCTWFSPRFSKVTNKTIGSVFIGDVIVWCLFENDLQCLSTAYPQTIETNAEELMYACFGKKLLPVTRVIYEAYAEEKNTIKKDFETAKDAAIWYFANTLFPTMHIDHFKQEIVSPFKLMYQIRNVLDGSSPYLKLQVTKK